MPAKLKVYRTPVGFHDAYVAAPSQKAALASWGSDANLFARGQAEQVTDPALMNAPLESPGTVIRVVRGTAAEHMAALPPMQPKVGKKHDTDHDDEGEAPTRRPKKRQESRPKPKPRPSRAALDKAEAAIAESEQRFDERQREIAAQEAELAREKKELRKAYDSDMHRLRREHSEAEKRFQQALSEWQDGT